ncbi:DNA starvation/stationary phase protection protein Dps [Gloeomargarita lithophora Alchichica-D10]|uniref:DNA starvation/stationary phase protection protein Dps n=1 Tax=Gloeomargarita lithophora Alchichica-D10 TaxID=1188229 RepID=A0A1J0ACK3_9CYAN|nr:DNA starvation/stationary phase protection protein Dps [Gloeomargarita lithophora]APB33668.1 DNA starvation/stationary phase protection protein Dps [Gloeomargarita lithophora Alchichica-D10]
MPTQVKPALYPTRLDLPTEVRVPVIEILNQALAHTFDLYSQTKQAHWNVKGSDFFALHELFDAMSGELLAYVDDLAERVTALAGVALGTLRTAAQASHLPAYPLDAVTGKDHLIALADRYAQYAKLVRQAIDQTAALGDADTADLFTGISRTADKRLWFLESHLHG